MGWLRKFLGIESKDHPGQNDRFPPERSYHRTLFMDDDNNLPSHSSMFDFPSHWRETSPNVTVIDPFEELENMMQDIFLGSVSSGTIFTGPNNHHHHSFNAPPPCPTNPRDQLLKLPDSEMSPDSGDDINRRSLPSSEHLEDNEHHHSMQPFNPSVPDRHSLFSLLDHFIGSLGKMESFSWPPSQDGGNFSDHQPATSSPRDAMIKKDTDLDEQTESSGLDSLLSKETPSYSGGACPRGDSLWRPDRGSNDNEWLSPFPGGDPHVQRSFTSTSIRRVVRPDGSIEERRTYRDSSGKEEVTVTEMDPATAGSLLTKDDFYGNNGSGSLLGSIFRSFF